MSTALLPMPPYEWFTVAWEQFCDKISNKRLPHANLLVGPAGIGLAVLAKAMQQYLLCDAPLEQLACGNCRPCQLNRSETHPDIKYVGLEEGAAQIKVDQIREISHFVNTSSQYSGVKVVLIEAAEAMNPNAANALLKNLEEPAGDTVFILSSTRAAKLLPTIRSRCQIINLALPSHQNAIDWLDQQNVDDAEMWLNTAGGAPLRAKAMSQSDYSRFLSLVHGELEGLLIGASQPLTVAQRWKEPGATLVLEILINVVENLIRSKMLSTPVVPSLSAIADLWANMDEPILFSLREKLLARQASLRSGSNLNPVNVMEDIVLDWFACGKRITRQRNVR
ncbi:MAG: DNA polymerase-3 subunit delta' [Flavobacteriales bacterium]|jgi:DNA polymerase-3 subunit delta'